MKNILVVAVLLSVTPILAQQPKEDSKTMYHQFDFWLGHWDVYKYGTDTLVGESRIETIIDSVGLLENYKTTRGAYQGKSLNKYNPEKKRWEQYWIDNSGLTLFLAGGIEEGKMVLSDEETNASSTTINKITWEKLKGGTVRQTWTTSTDKGKTWKLAFDGIYKRKKD